MLPPVLRTVAALVVLVVVTSGCDPVADEAPLETPDVAGDPAVAATLEGTAAAQLATLPVKGRAPMTGYDRARFGPSWLDADRNGCDTRNDVLAEHLEDLAFEPGTRDCVVLSGSLHDPYTGDRVDFVRGDGTLVDIDHVVALANAWVTGAQRWDVRERAALANDPMNLLPVDASANRQKGDADAATWLPPSKRFRCEYVARQVGVKAKYGLWVTPPERAAVERVLADCPDEPSVPDSGAPVRVDQAISDPGAGAPAPGSFGSCAEARAARATPVRRGDPGYGSQLDGDGDGVACE
jgi:hypothetical protein